jgi:hypothetical protein
VLFAFIIIITFSYYLLWLLGAINNHFHPTEENYILAKSDNPQVCIKPRKSHPIPTPMQQNGGGNSVDTTEKNIEFKFKLQHYKFVQHHSKDY